MQRQMDGEIKSVTFVSQSVPITEIRHAHINYIQKRKHLPSHGHVNIIQTI